METRLTAIWPISEPSDYKVHFSRHNKREHPLDVFACKREEWRKWQEYRPQNNEFNRPYIFSLMRFYREPEIWLFGGVWEVLDRPPGRYVVGLTDQGSEFIGRLKLRSPYKGRAARVKLEKQIEGFTVSEILAEDYSGKPFSGRR